MTQQQRIVMELRSLANKVELGHYEAVDLPGNGCLLDIRQMHGRPDIADAIFTLALRDTRPVDYYDPDIYELHGEEADDARD